MNKKKVLIVDDEKKAARFLELELAHEGYAVDVEYDGRDALAQILYDDYDLMLLDVMLPGINGFEVCRRVRQTSSIPIIMLTAKDETTDMVMGLDTGADDYITKPFVIEELLARVRVIFRGKGNSIKPDSVLHIGDLAMDNAAHQVTRLTENIELTKTEYDLLEYLMKNAGIVLTREQIINTVWGYDYPGNDNIVDVYIRYLRNKIDLPYGTKLIQTVRGVGYIIKNNVTQNDE